MNEYFERDRNRAVKNRPICQYNINYTVYFSIYDFETKEIEDIDIFCGVYSIASKKSYVDIIDDFILSLNRIAKSYIEHNLFMYETRIEYYYTYNTALFSFNSKTKRYEKIDDYETYLDNI